MRGALSLRAGVELPHTYEIGNGCKLANLLVNYKIL